MHDAPVQGAWILHHEVERFQEKSLQAPEAQGNHHEVVSSQVDQLQTLVFDVECHL